MIHVIAEAGVNYDTIDELVAPSAIHYILAAKAAGADYIKFQLFNQETIKDSPLKDRLKEYILNEGSVEYLHEEAKKRDIGFILTPMYLEAVDIAAKHADLIKIRFKDHENKPLIDKAIATGKRVLVSVPLPPLDPAYRYNPYLLPIYCIPKYPPEPEDFSLDAATCCRGVSLHFPHTLFDLAFAINRNYDEVYIEKHVMTNTLVRTGQTTTTDGITGNIYERQHPIDENVSITFDELKSFISQFKLIDRMKRIRI